MTRKAWIIGGVAAAAVMLVVTGAALIRAVPRFATYNFLREAKPAEETEIVYDVAGKKTTFSQRSYRLKGEFWSVADDIEKELLAKGWRSGFRPAKGGAFKFRMFMKTPARASAPVLPMQNTIIVSQIPRPPARLAGKRAPQPADDGEVSVSIMEGPIESSWLRDLSARFFPSKAKRSTVVVGRSSSAIVYSTTTRPGVVRTVVPGRAAPSAPKKP